MKMFWTPAAEPPTLNHRCSLRPGVTFLIFTDRCDLLCNRRLQTQTVLHQFKVEDKQSLDPLTEAGHKTIVVNSLILQMRTKETANQTNEQSKGKRREKAKSSNLEVNNKQQKMTRNWKKRTN